MFRVWFSMGYTNLRFSPRLICRVHAASPKGTRPAVLRLVKVGIRTRRPLQWPFVIDPVRPLKRPQAVGAAGTKLCTKSQIPPALAAWSLSFTLGCSFGVTVRYHLLQQRGITSKVLRAHSSEKLKLHAAGSRWYHLKSSRGAL